MWIKPGRASLSQAQRHCRPCRGAPYSRTKSGAGTVSKKAENHRSPRTPSTGPPSFRQIHQQRSVATQTGTFVLLSTGSIVQATACLLCMSPMRSGSRQGVRVRRYLARSPRDMHKEKYPLRGGSCELQRAGRTKTVAGTVSKKAEIHQSPRTPSTGPLSFRQIS